MIHQILNRIGWSKPSSEVLLHRELNAIELTLVHRNEQVLGLYNEMDQLRARREVVKGKLGQWGTRKMRSFKAAH